MIELHPDSVLDIGANRGEWTKSVRPLWPNAKFMMIEANPGCLPYLQETGEAFLIVLLGATNQKAVPFYTLDDTATGASVYREIGTDLYDDVEPIILTQFTLDDILPVDLGYEYDLIKLDTQGSELDIIKGGLKLVAKASHLLLEVSTKPYNKGAPLLPEVASFLKDIGFSRQQTVCSHEGIHQHDVLFSR